MKGGRQRACILAILVPLAGVLAPPAARAQDETDTMHFRARAGLPATKRDREQARWLLEQWRESESVSSEPGDQALGRALAGIAEGRGLAPAELGALDRYAATRRGDRLAAEGETPGHVAGAEPGADFAESARGPRRRLVWMLAVVGAGIAVFALGIAWILAARRLRKG